MPRMRQRAHPPALTLKVSGPGIGAGRIPVPDLLAICQHAQSAVTRQAESLEGLKTLRPGPKSGKVVDECTLELVSLGAGSATLSFDPAKPQVHLPHIGSLADEAIATVGESIVSLSKGRTAIIDSGVLDSLKHMGEVFANGVRSIQWIVPARPGRKRIAATFNAKVQARVVEKLKPPVKRPFTIDGVLEMADFKPAEQRCRIHPASGGPINCTFKPHLADQIYSLLRKAAHIEGDGTYNAQTDRLETVDIKSVTPLDPMTVNAGSFFEGWTLDQLAQMQNVVPIRNPKSLGGGWPDDEDVDDVLADIYQHRDQ